MTTKKKKEATQPINRAQETPAKQNHNKIELAKAEPLKMTFPTVLTIIRMALSILFLVFILLPHTWARITALVIFIIAAITDKIDGDLARKQKSITDLGAFLDPLADKMLINLAFLALVYLNIVPLWVFAIILIRDFAVDGMRMMVARTGITVSASFYGKLKTTFQITALIILVFNMIVQLEFFTIIGNITLYLALILTIFSGADYLIKGYKSISNKH